VSASDAAAGAVATDPRVGVIRVEERHAGLLADFFRAVWDTAATAEKVLAARREAARLNPIAPGEDVPTFAFLVEGRIVGYVTTIPMRLWTGRERPAHWVKGLWVLPEVRNGPVGFLLLKEAVRHLGDAMAMVVDPAPRRLFQALGFTDLGVLPNFLRLLRPGRVLQRLDLEALGMGGALRRFRPVLRMAQLRGVAALAGAAAGTGLRAWTIARGGVTRRRALVEPLDREGIDRLWTTVRTRLPGAPARSGAGVEQLLRTLPEGEYRVLGVRSGSRLDGMGIVRPPRASSDARLNGLRIATLSDALFEPGDASVGRALIAAAERVARALDADALVCSASDPRIQRLLRSRAFLSIPGNVHVLARGPNGPLDAPADLANWWLMRADSFADEAL
jgi:hypothetical protein